MMRTPAGARRRWDALWRELRLAPPAAARDELLAAYDEPHRHYHTRRHLAECLAHLDPVRDRCRHPAAVELALWYHDAMYDPRRDRNEADSAAWAELVLFASGSRASLRRRVAALILTTQHRAAAPAGDAGIIADLDLAILGAPGRRFAEYERQIRREYAWVPAPAYREGRAKVLRGLMARRTIYVTAGFRQRFEAPARANLARSLARLGR